MFGLHKISLPVSILVLLYSTASFAESGEQSSMHEQMNAQLQQLKTQLASANERIAVLEEYNKLEKQMSKNLFAGVSETLHGRNR